MAGAARFLRDWLIETPEGTLGTAPATSPENGFLLESGKSCCVSRSSTMDMAIIRVNCRNGSGILKKKNRSTDMFHTYMDCFRAMGFIRKRRPNWRKPAV